MNLHINLVKAFTKNKNEGNPAGVVFDADSLTSEQMIRVSKELGFSESAFVQKSDKASYKVRFFTPTQEVDLCGHATIATFHTLFESGKLNIKGESATTSQESNAGILPVTVHKDGLVVMTQPNPKYSNPVENREEVASLLSLSSNDLIKNLPIQAVSTGSLKVMIPIKNRELLFSIKPQLEEISKYCKRYKYQGFYPFTLDTVDKNSDFHTRQFNPMAGINEDPITGVAAGALGCYAVKYNILNKKRFVIEQGYVLKKPGKVYIDIMESVEVGGYATTFGTKVLKI